MTSVAEHLNNAADHIAAFGHHKGSGFGTGDGGNHTAPACLVGALTLSMTGPGVTAFDIATAVLPIRKYLGRCPVAWNDDPATTGEQVVEVLRAVALIEAAKESAPVEAGASL